MQTGLCPCDRGIGFIQHCCSACYIFQRPGRLSTPGRRLVRRTVAAGSSDNGSTSKQSTTPLQRYLHLTGATYALVFHAQMAASIAGKGQCAIFRRFYVFPCRPQTFTSEPEGIFQDLEKTALNPFIDSKGTPGTTSEGRSDESQRRESWQQQMGERWARAIYSYYNWRTVRAPFCISGSAALYS